MNAIHTFIFNSIANSKFSLPKCVSESEWLFRIIICCWYNVYEMHIEFLSAIKWFRTFENQTISLSKRECLKIYSSYSPADKMHHDFFSSNNQHNIPNNWDRSAISVGICVMITGYPQYVYIYARMHIVRRCALKIRPYIQICRSKTNKCTKNDYSQHFK